MNVDVKSEAVGASQESLGYATSEGDRFPSRRGRDERRGEDVVCGAVASDAAHKPDGPDACRTGAIAM